MNMTEMSPFVTGQPVSSEMYIEQLLGKEETPDVGSRFMDGFNQLLEAKKHEAVLDLLREEFPHLADDANFVKRVVQHLGNDFIEEKRFVFLALNPKFKK